MTVLTLDSLRTAFHLPREAAAVALGVSVNDLKKALKVLKVERWPYRKLSSLQALQQDLEEQLQIMEATEDNKAQCLELREMHARIGEDMAKIRLDPNHPLDEALHKLRLQNYKARFIKAHGGGAPKPLRLPPSATLPMVHAAAAEAGPSAAGASTASASSFGSLARRSAPTSSAALKRSAGEASMQWTSSSAMSRPGGASDTDSQGLARASRSRRSPGLPPPGGQLHASQGYGDPQRMGSGMGHMGMLPMLPENDVLGGNNRLAYSAPLYDESAGGVPAHLQRATYTVYEPQGASGSSGRLGARTSTGGLGDGVAAIKLETYDSGPVPPWMVPLGTQPLQWQQPTQPQPPQATSQQQVGQQQQHASRYLSCPADWAGNMGVQLADTGQQQQAMQQVRPQMTYLAPNSQPMPVAGMAGPQGHHARPHAPQGPSSQPVFGSGQGPAQQAWTAPHLVSGSAGWPPQHATHVPNLPSVQPKATPLEEMLDELISSSTVGVSQNQQSTQLPSQTRHLQPSQQQMGSAQFITQLQPSGPVFTGHIQQQQQQHGAASAPVQFHVGAGGARSVVLQQPAAQSQQWAPRSVAAVSQPQNAPMPSSFFLLNSDDDDDDELSKLLSSPNARQHLQQGHGAGAQQQQLQQPASAPLGGHYMVFGAQQAQQQQQFAQQQLQLQARAASQQQQQQAQQQAQLQQQAQQVQAGGFVMAQQVQQQQQQQRLQSNQSPQLGAASAPLYGGAQDPSRMPPPQQQQPYQRMQQHMTHLSQQQQQQMLQLQLQEQRMLQQPVVPDFQVPGSGNSMMANVEGAAGSPLPGLGSDWGQPASNQGQAPSAQQQQQQQPLSMATSVDGSTAAVPMQGQQQGQQQGQAMLVQQGSQQQLRSGSEQPGFPDLSALWDEDDMKI